MAGRSVERRGRRGEGDDLPRGAEDLGETRIDEAGESRTPVEGRLREALEDLAQRESREERIAQKLAAALEDLGRMEQRRESTESRLREALESIRDDHPEKTKVEGGSGPEVSEITRSAPVAIDSAEKTKVYIQESLEEREPAREVPIRIQELNDGRVRSVLSERDQKEWNRETLSEGLARADADVPREHPVKSGEHREGNAPVDDLRESKPRFGEIRTREEFKEACEHYPELEYKRSYQLQIEDVKSYFDSADDRNSVKPSLVKEVENREIRRMYETIHGGPPELKIESMKDVDSLLEKHQQERNSPDFDERYRHCGIYFEIKGDFSLKRDEQAKKYNVGHGIAGEWRKGVEPTLIKHLRHHEEEKMLREWYESGPQISEDALREFRVKEIKTRPERSEDRTGVHEIDSQVIRRAVEHLRDGKDISVDDIAAALEGINRTVLDETKRVRYADFRPAVHSETMATIERLIRTERSELERSLSERLGIGEDSLRVAAVNGRVYTWIPKSRTDELVDVYEDQFYYFNNRFEYTNFIEDLGRRLGAEGDKSQSLRHLNEVIRQLTDEGDGAAARAHPIERKSTRLEGKVIRLYLDSTDGRLSDLEGRVNKVTGINGQAGIDNPRFPSGKQLEVLKARLAAIIVSDCYLGESGNTMYNQASLERIAKVQEILRNFGDITLEGPFRKGVYEVHIQNQIGLMMIHEGMTPGSKSIQNPGLPKGFVNWSEEARRAYLEELIPEDGNFSTSKGFSWNRNHALYDGNEGGKHDFRSIVSTPEINLIIDEGTQTEGLVPQYSLAYGKLEKLQFSEDSMKADAAKHLIAAIHDSPNNLVEDEKKIAESLGIRISLSTTMVRYYPKSDGVSVRNLAGTARKDDAIRWGTICPPNDERKRNEVENWLRGIVENWLDKKEWSNWFD